ncbi:MAG TPA: chemotaxis protein CheW, partial [Thermoanaerobaculia bacterium]|nr:chemotaxis protein CheW [Thermoanaerobaculia bacterium]
MSEMRAANGAGPDGDPRKADRGEDLADLLASIEDRLDPDRPRAALAHAPAEPPAAAERSVVFLLGATRCAVPIDRVLEIGDVPAITPVPNVPAWVRGVANLRGDILAIVDLGAYVGLPPR